MGPRVEQGAEAGAGVGSAPVSPAMGPAVPGTSSARRTRRAVTACRGGPRRLSPTPSQCEAHSVLARPQPRLVVPHQEPSPGEEGAGRRTGQRRGFEEPSSLGVGGGGSTADAAVGASSALASGTRPATSVAGARARVKSPGKAGAALEEGTEGSPRGLAVPVRFAQMREGQSARGAAACSLATPKPCAASSFQGRVADSAGPAPPASCPPPGGFLRRAAGGVAPRPEAGLSGDGAAVSLMPAPQKASSGSRAAR